MMGCRSGVGVDGVIVGRGEGRKLQLDRHYHRRRWSDGGGDLTGLVVSRRRRSGGFGCDGGGDLAGLVVSRRRSERRQRRADCRR
ncbi:hypothetical protein P3L10_029920 [Capsicum annuum]